MGLTWLRILALLESLCSHLFFLCLGVGLGGPVWMLTGPVSIPGRYWETVERLRINQFYGAPTAIRLLLRYGDEWVKKYDRSSLKVLGSGKCSSTGWSSKSLGITLCLFPQMPRAAVHETPKSGDCTIWGWLHKQALGSSVLNLIFQLCPLVFLLAVGEPINKEAWEWYFRVVGETRCPVVDTWWQTGEMHVIPCSSFCSPRL